MISITQLKYYYDFHRQIIFKFTKQLKTKSLNELFPGIENTIVALKTPLTIYGSTSLYEIQILCSIAKFNKISTFFEIGSFNGVTSSNIFLNTNAMVYTLDLPPNSDVSGTKYTIENEMHKILHTDKLYQQLLDDKASKVIQLYGDSAVFDFDKYKNSIDMVFVDGAHAYDFVLSDTKNSLKMIKKGGYILWHDYNFYFKDVQRVLHQLNHKYQLFHIEGTSLAILKT